MTTYPGSRSLPAVFVLGSSLTIQFGPFLEQELSGQFRYDRKRDTETERAEDDLDIPQGASGGDSGQVLAYLRGRRRTDPIDADILLLQCGLHDMRTDPKTGKRRVEPADFAANLHAALVEAANMGLEVVWLRITPVVDEVHNRLSTAFHRFSADVDTYNELADHIMEKLGIQVIDLHCLCATQVPHDLIDHIHYNEKARREQAAFIARELSVKPVSIDHDDGPPSRPTSPKFRSTTPAKTAPAPRQGIRPGPSPTRFRNAGQSENRHRDPN
ncbi:MAG: SGNH/GDSL hydrolase family protein [Kiritimatiellia bacterium]